MVCLVHILDIILFKVSYNFLIFLIHVWYILKGWNRSKNIKSNNFRNPVHKTLVFVFYSSILPWRLKGTTSLKNITCIHALKALTRTKLIKKKFLWQKSSLAIWHGIVCVYYNYLLFKTSILIFTFLLATCLLFLNWFINVQGCFAVLSF